MREALCLVGTTGFEPAASPTPRVRATRLRHVPSRLFQYGLKECFVKSGCWAVTRSAPLAARRLNLGVTIGEEIKNLAKLLTNLSQGRALFAGLRFARLLGRFGRSRGGAEPCCQRGRRLQTSRRRLRRWCRSHFVAGSAAAVVGQFFLGAGNGVLLVIEQLFDSQGHLDVAAAISALAGVILLWRQHGKFGLPVTQHMRLHAGKFAHFADLEEQLFGSRDGCLVHLRKLAEIALWSQGRRFSGTRTAAMLTARRFQCQYLHLGPGSLVVRLNV